LKKALHVREDMAKAISRGPSGESTNGRRSRSQGRL
jgi:hypothetical protein